MPDDEEYYYYDDDDRIAHDIGVYLILDRCNPWPHVANRHMSLSQLLSTCCYLFTISSSGLLFVQRLRPASHAHFRHSHIPELICGFNSSIDNGNLFVKRENYLCLGDGTSTTWGKHSDILTQPSQRQRLGTFARI